MESLEDAITAELARCAQAEAAAIARAAAALVALEREYDAARLRLWRQQWIWELRERIAGLEREAGARRQCRWYASETCT